MIVEEAGEQGRAEAARRIHRGPGYRAAYEYIGKDGQPDAEAADLNRVSHRLPSP